MTCFKATLLLFEVINKYSSQMFHIVFVPDSVRTVEFDNALLMSIATKGFY